MLKRILFPQITGEHRPDFSPVAFGLRVSLFVVAIALILYVGGLSLFIWAGMVPSPHHALLIGCTLTVLIAAPVAFTVTYMNSRMFEKLLSSHELFVRLSRTDPLTGLLNRAGIKASTRLHAHPLHVAILDIDHFKSINDTHGHDTGDCVIVHVARVMRRTLPGHCVLGRLGGEEFLVLWGEADADKAREQIDRMRDTIARHAYVHEGEAIPFTISAGLASRSQAEAFASALKRADTALYRAKQLGRNRVVAAG